MEQLSPLVSYFINFDHLQEDRQAFRSLDQFCQRQLKTGPLIIFSGPKEIIKGQAQEQFPLPRFHLNKDSWESTGDDHDRKKSLNSLMSSFQKKQWVYTFQLKNEDYVGIFCGENLTQFFGAVCSYKDQKSLELIKHLGAFMQKYTQTSLQIAELKKIQNLVHVDDVTGLFNQRKLKKDLTKLIDRYHKFKESFCVFFIDIDHFKQVNDGHGHLTGTHLLKQVADVLIDSSRETDLLYRYGGDEFVLIMPHITLNMGKSIGQRILKTINTFPFEIVDNLNNQNKNQVKLGVSIGLAAFPDHAQDEVEILKIADKMMYEAKKRGRGQVCIADTMFDS